MLAMQGGPALVGRAAGGWMDPRRSSENAQEKMKRLMDLPATDDPDWTRCSDGLPGFEQKKAD